MYSEVTFKGVVLECWLLLVTRLPGTPNIHVGHWFSR